jgi:DHA1 family tetracycline resistance protein-like MFS transporter
MLVGPGMFSFVFAKFIAPERPVAFPGAPWYLASVLLLVAVSVAFVVAPKRTAVATP